MLPIQDFYPQLDAPKKVVVTMHQKPDGDAMGSVLGLKHFLTQLGHTVTVISPTNWADFLKWMPAASDVIDFERSKDVALKFLEETELLFCCDFNVLHRTKLMERPLMHLQCTKVLIDHHEQPQQGYFDYGISLTNKSSTAEMVFDMILDSGHGDKINLEIAQCLYTGVMTDTGSFRFPHTTVNVHRMVARLMETGFNHTLVHENIYDSFLENRIRFIGHALLNRLEVLYEYNTALMAISKKELLRFNIKTGDTEGLVNQLLTIQGIRFGALVIDRDEERKWSFRSKGNFDVNTFARTYFDGGGHFNAAGGKTNDTLEGTVEKFRQVIQQYQKHLQ